MKSLTSILTSLEKIEAAHAAMVLPFPYVIRLSDPPTEPELAQMRRNNTAGKPFVVMPHKCATADEWMARYALEPRT